MPAGDKKYLLVAKRLLTFTSSSVAVPVCRSSLIDDRWYNVPRRPLTGFIPLSVVVALLLNVATLDDFSFFAALLLAVFTVDDFSVFAVLLLAVATLDDATFAAADILQILLGNTR